MLDDDKKHYLTMLLAEAEGYSPGLPDGVFFLDEESEVLALGEDLCLFVQKKGYKRVFPPLFEFYETYARGGEIARKSFSFKDKDGSLLTLRYDMTTPIARMVAQKYTKADLPLRLFYYGDVFREQPFHQGKPRQIRQLGIELIGETLPDGDAEVVELAGAMLSRMGKYRLVIGDIRLYQECLSRFSLSAWQSEAIHRCFQMKDIPSLREVLLGVDGDKRDKESLVALVGLVGTLNESKHLRSQVQQLGLKGEEVFEGIEVIKRRLPLEMRESLLVDLGMVKDFGYYTAMTLEGYVAQSGYAICHGGRYDTLYQGFGKDFSAVGFALDLSYTFR